MNEILNAISRLLSDVVLPALKGVQSRQVQQLAQNDRIEVALCELREHIEQQFGHLHTQLIHNCDELTRLRATLIALQVERSAISSSNNLIH